MNLSLYFYFTLALSGLFTCSQVPVDRLDNSLSITQNTELPSFGGMIMHSKDGGLSWQEIKQDANAKSEIQDLMVSDDKIILAYDRSTIFTKSIDPTAPWSMEKIDEYTLAPNNPEAIRVSNIFAAPSGTYIDINMGDLYWKGTKAGYWQPITKPNNYDVTRDVIEDENGLIYLATEYGVYTAQKQNGKWTKIFPYGTVVDMMLDGNTLIVSGINGVYRTEDKGANWQSVDMKPLVGSFGMTTPNKRTYRFIKSGQTIMAIDNDLHNARQATGKIQYSADGGKTWNSHIADNTLNSIGAIVSFVVSDDKMYCTTPKGLYNSLDGGNTWTKILHYEPVNNEKNNKVMSVQASNGILYCYEWSFGC